MDRDKTRKEMIKTRNSLSSNEVKDFSLSISIKICSMKEFISAHTVLFYYPIKNEVDLTELMKLSMGNKIICLPYIEDEKRIMTARQIATMSNLNVRKYGILSPSKNCKVIDKNTIDFVIVPMVSYDDNMNRIGYGGGYYDTFLMGCKNALKCGVAYSFQKSNNIKIKKHDIAMDLIVTE